VAADLTPPGRAGSDYALRPAEPADAGILADLSARPVNAYSRGLDLISGEHSTPLIGALGQQMWGTPMVAHSPAGAPLGIFALTEVDSRDLSGNLFAVFVGVGAASALNQYLAILFWAYPLRRVAAYALRPGGEYRTTLVKAGFESEGVLTGAALRGGQAVDLEVLSTVRTL
jgi:hypothetical protein